MSKTVRATPRLFFAKALAEIPHNVTVILVALTLTGLAASMVLARQATSMVRSESANVWIYPSGVFRAPHPAILAMDVIIQGSR